MAGRDNRPWCKDEATRVISDWGTEPTDRTAKRQQRSEDAVRRKIRREGMSSSVTRGVKTLTELADETGYHRRDIKRAIKLAGKRVTRSSSRPGACYLLTEEQCADIIEALGRETAEADERVSPSDIAARMGVVSRRTAYSMRRRLGIPDGVLSTDAQLLLESQMVAAEGASIREVARQTGRAKSTVHTVARRLCLGPGRLTQGEVDTLIAALAEIPRRRRDGHPDPGCTDGDA